MITTRELFNRVDIKYDEKQALILKGVDVDVANSLWILQFTSNELISSDYYNEIITKLQSELSRSDLQVKILFTLSNSKLENQDHNKMIHYMQLFRKIHTNIDSVLKSVSISINKNTVVFEVNTPFERNLVKSIENQLQHQIDSIGITDYRFEINQREIVAEQFEEQFPEEIVVAKKPVASTERMLWGDDILKRKSLPIEEIINPQNMISNAVIEGTIFNIEIRELKKSSLLTIMVADDAGYTMICKTFTGFNNRPPTAGNFAQLAKNMRVKIFGKKSYDRFINDEVIEILSVASLPSSEENLYNDTFDTKRVELHAHSKMSKNNGISSLAEYAQIARKMGHKGFAVTDHHTVQAFVEAESIAKKGDLKLVYGVEASVINESIITHNPDERKINDITFTIFDVETTGLSANFNKLIEIGAVKMKNDMVIDHFQCFIKIDQPLSEFTTSLTGITDEDLAQGVDLETALRLFHKFSEDTVLVAHNAIFDLQFLARNYERVLSIELDQPVLDTLELSRYLNQENTYHSLKILAKRYGVALDSKSHHRADYDAQKLSEIFVKMMNDVECETLVDLNNINNVNKTRGHHTLIYVRNQQGLPDLYKLVSDSNTVDYFMEPRMHKNQLLAKRKNLILVAAGCINSELMDSYLNHCYEDQLALMAEFDYIELLPVSQYTELIGQGTFENEEQIIQFHKDIIAMAEITQTKVIVSGNVHYATKSQAVCKDILIAKDYKPSKLKKNDEGIEEFIDKKRFKSKTKDKTIKNNDQYFKTTDQMFEAFKHLPYEKLQEIIIDNPNEILDSVDTLKIIPDDLYTPEIEGVDDKLKEMVYGRAVEIYGEDLPELITKRLEKEVNSITSYGFSVIYYISYKLVKYSLDNGYLVGSRGSVGSSLVATLMQITEVNPLPPHYVCPSCKNHEFIEDGSYGSGFDLPAKLCPNCGTNYLKDGQDIPFETFLGFEGDKVPDIDLNFSGEFQGKAHEYVRSKESMNDDELFDFDHAFRAGTIGTIAEKTAFAYVRNYFELIDKPVRKSDILYIASNLEGIKRTTGQHPGGIIVVPSHREIYEFTALQFPADDVKQPWRTTHFDFHAIHDNLLKLDILGHDDPTMLKRLKDLTGVDPQSIDVTDEKIMQLFSGTESLNVSGEEILCDLGTMGIPEFGTNFVMEMLKDTKPKTFSELVQISGLSHGTDVWLSNAKDLIDQGVCELKDVIGCRDDIMVFLMYKGVDPLKAFNIMEKVRKGKGVNEDDIRVMKENNVDDWYIDSCQKIKYMFPKAHAAAYVLMALRIAYFKVYYPLEYYAAYFSSRVSDFDAASMLRGAESLKNKITLVESQDGELSDVKRGSLLKSLSMSLEMVVRGFDFLKFDLEKSHSRDFVVDKENNGLIMPFSAIDGLGEKEAAVIMEERAKGKFLTKEDFKKRTRVKTKSYEQLEFFEVFENMDENNQIQLF